MNDTLNDILKHPKHKDFFTKHGYVKYSGASMERLKIFPTVTFMLPIGITELELVALFEEWKSSL